MRKWECEQKKDKWNTYYKKTMWFGYQMEIPMTEREKMLAGELYDCGDEELLTQWHKAKNVVIGAGSVVTKNIPDNVIAVGSPCRVVRRNQ